MASNSEYEQLRLFEDNVRLDFIPLGLGIENEMNNNLAIEWINSERLTKEIFIDTIKAFSGQINN